MTPRSFFTILIKIIGLYLMIDNLSAIPQIVNTFMAYRGMSSNSDGIYFLFFYVVMVLGFFYLILKFCLFKTDWIIDILSLDKHFEEERFELNMHRSTMLNIAVIVIGALLFLNSLPMLCKSIYTYIGEKQIVGKFGENVNLNWLIYYFFKTFIGFFLMTNNRMVVNLIERKRKIKEYKGDEIEIKGEE
jgi:hypothetical protein